MKKLILGSLISIFLLSQAVISSYGKENNGNSKTKIEVKQNNNENRIKIENEENENKNRIKIKIENDKGEFKIWGPIQSFTSSSITIDGRTITIDQNTRTVGQPNVDMYAKVEGTINNEDYLAEKIVVDNRNKNDEDDNISPTVTISPTLSPSVTEVSPTTSIEPTVSVEPTISISPTVTEGLTQAQQAEKQFTLGQIIEALEKFLNSLKEITRI